MVTYVLSDLHLHADEQPYLFTAAKEAVFTAVADEVLASGSHLVLGGDVFDITGMTPPQGLDDFFAAVLSPADARSAQVQAAGRVRSLAEQLAAVRARFPGFFTRLAALAAAGRLSVIPGNHDYHLGNPAGQAALSAQLGVAAPVVDVFRDESTLWVVHGNQFDPLNQVVDHSSSRGAAITMALYHAMMPALAALGVDDAVIGAIPSVRPEENMVAAMDRYLEAPVAGRLLLAFTRLLMHNGYFQGLDHIKVQLATSLVPGSITPARVRAALASQTDVKGEARQGGEAILAGRLLALPGQPPPRLVALGHTHQIDGTDRYVNLGTWIDHVEGLLPEQLARAERNLPVLRVADSEDAVLYDAAALVSGAAALRACPVLWQTAGETPGSAMSLG